MRRARRPRMLGATTKAMPVSIVLGAKRRVMKQSDDLRGPDRTRALRGSAIGLPPRRRPQGWRACVSPLMRAHVSGPPADVAGSMATSTKTPYSGKQFWWSEHDPEYRELIDTRGRWDVESTLGEWTRVECINMYQTEHDELFRGIRDGKPINNGEYM